MPMAWWGVYTEQCMPKLNNTNCKESIMLLAIELHYSLQNFEMPHKPTLNQRNFPTIFSYYALMFIHCGS